MAKKKNKTSGGQQHLSPEAFIRQRMRSVPLGKCYVSDNIDDAGEGIVIVTRQHTGGRISAGLFLVDMQCTGVKDCHYRLRMEDYELEEQVLNRMVDHVQYRECTYEEAHNRIYGSIDFADEAGIKPHRDFALMKYFLEEDTDDIPLIEYDYGREGKHFLVCQTQLEASKYLPLLEKNLGKGNYDYLIGLDYQKDYADETDDIDKPITMEEILSGFDEDTIKENYKLLFHEFPNSKKPAKQIMIDAVKEHPKEILYQLSDEELTMLGILYYSDEDTSQYSYQLKAQLSPIKETAFEKLGFANGYIEDYTYILNFATDFLDAVMKHVREVTNQTSFQTKCVLEATINGLANIYGAVRLGAVEEFLKDKDLGIRHNLYDLLLFTIDSSFELRTMEYNDNCTSKEFSEQVKSGDIIFVSPFGWENRERMLKLINKESINNSLGMKEITRAAGSLPLIKVKGDEKFKDFLRTKMGYNKIDVDRICSNLWYRVQHEYDDDFDEEDWYDYFLEYAFDEAPLTVDIDEATDVFQEYVDAIPRWVTNAPEDNDAPTPRKSSEKLISA